MSESGTGFRYIVLADSTGQHMVCVTRHDAPDWLQVIARFSDRSRAEQYADAENDISIDCLEDLCGDEFVGKPEFDPPESGLRFISAKRHSITETVNVVEQIKKPASTPIAPEPVALPEPATPPQKDEGQAGTIPNFIVRLLPGWMEKYPGGPTIKQVADQTKLDAHDVRAAFEELRNRNLAVVWRADGRAPLQVAPLDFKPPVQKELSTNQEVLLDYLVRLDPADDGTVSPPSSKEAHKATGIPQGSLGATAYELEQKGKIEIVARGDQLKPPKYRVVHRSILQQAIRNHQGTKDVSHLVFDDPPPGRAL